MNELFDILSKKFYEKYQTDITEKFEEFKDLSDYVAIQFSRKVPQPSYEEYQREVLKQGLQHFQKKILEKQDNKNILDFVDSYDTFRNRQTRALKGMYQHSGYTFERQEMQTLILDIDINTGTTFSVDLNEPFIIDKLSNIYLDGFTTFKCNTSDSENEMAFVLTIDQFNIKSSSNKIEYNGSLIIPNEQTTASDPSIVRVHKGKKFNYICQINPQKLKRITGKITAIDGSTSMFPGTPDGRVILEFLIVAAEKMPWK